MLRSCYCIKNNNWKLIKKFCLFLKFVIFVVVAVAITCPGHQTT